MGARLFVPRPATAGPATASPETHRPSGRLREAAALLLVASALFLVLALLSCNVVPGSTEEVSSWVGPTGGYVAHFLAQGFGVAAWLAPLELSLIAIPLFRGRPMGDLWLRIAGDLTLAVVAAALAQVAAAGAVVFGHAPVGGNVGLLFGELMREFFSSVGSFLVGSTIVGLILIHRATFSFIEACRRTLALLERLAAKLNLLGARLRSAWREARQLRRAEVERAPRIEPCDPDEAILLHLTDEDDADWIPPEETGAPPLALSQALKNARGPEFEGLVFATPEAPLVAKLASEPTSSALAVPSPETKAEGRPRTRGRRQKDLAADDDADGTREGKADTKADAKGAGKTKANGAKTEPNGDDSSPNAAPGPSGSAPSPNAAPLGSAKAPHDAASPPGAPKPDPKKELLIVDTQPEREVERPKAASPVPRRGEFQLPSSTLFDPPSDARVEVDRDAILEHARRLEKTLADYGVTGKVEEVRPGPTVTMYEVAFEAGTRVSKVASLADDLALGLSRKVRIIAPIPGKSLIGFELPNDERQPVCLRELIEDQRFEKLSERAPLPVVLGRDIVGAPFYADLASMPHVIVAGATGAGKSVGLNVMLSSLLLKRTPDDLRLLMIDPKVVELAPFDGIPHLLLPVVTDMKQASTALRWAVEEMERRYQLFADAGTKNIGTYNAWVKRVIDGEIPAPVPTEVEALTADGALVTVPAAKDGNDGRPLPGKLPYIVIVVDEFADLMMQQGKEVEAAVARLAQKARAAGMHVVLATQRPSVDVITGTIKANFPSRIAFRVAQRVDSKTILDEQGAELLLGRGDMLVKLNGSTDTRRAQCPFVSEEEVERLTDHLRKQGSPQYHEAILLTPDEDGESEEEDEAVDARFDEAVRIVAETQRCSTSWLQRKMTIGYNRAAKMVEMMERRGMVGPPNGSRDRDVLMPPP